MKSSVNYAQMSKEELIKELSKAHETISEIQGQEADYYGLNLEDSAIEDAIGKAIEIMNDVKVWLDGPELSSSERRRLHGLQARRYGFVDEVSDVIAVNPQFLPSNVTELRYKGLIRQFELIRNLNLTIQQISRLMGDIQLILGEELYQLALSYYGSVASAARRHVPGAQELFDFLKPFFSRRRIVSEEPTKRQLERDFHALEHGAKTGEIIIQNEGDKVVKGRRTVIDETHKPEGHWKETAEGEMY